MNQLVSQPTLQ